MSEPKFLWATIKPVQIQANQKPIRGYSWDGPPSNAYTKFIEARAFEAMKADCDRLRAALEKILDRRFLRDTSMLCSNPPQNGAVWDIQNIAREALTKETSK